MQNEDAYEGMTEPSGYTVSEADRMAHSFSDITILYRNESNFIAKGIRFGKWFILKGINPHLRRDEGRLAMLRKEFDLLINMEHPGVVRVSSLEEVDGFGPCIVMQYIDGLTLEQWLRTPLQFEQRMDISLQILDAVGYVHSKGVVHRDIKPDNILITRIGQRSILIDFGLADTDDYSILKHPAGTPDYISEEQKRSSVPNIRNDIYSLGKVLRKLLPERRFNAVFRNCEDREKRPDSVKLLERKIKRADRVGRWLPWVSVAAILIMACAIIIPLAMKHPTSEQTGDSATILTVPPTLREELRDSEIINEELSPSNTDIPQHRPVDIGNSINVESSIKEDKLNSKETVTSITPNKDLTPTVEKKNRDDSFKELLHHGSLLLEEEWEDTALAFLDTVSNPAAIPKIWDMKRLNAIKNNYIQILKMSITENTSNMQQYSLDLEDIEEMNRIYNNQIKGYQNQWINLQNKKISEH